MTYVHIHAPLPNDCDLSKSVCPTCGKKTYFVTLFYAWYGPESTCLKCGEHFNEDGRAERPFKPRWREENKEAARAKYRRYSKMELPSLRDTLGPGDE